MVLNATFTISLSYFYRKWEWKNIFKLIQIDLHHGKWDKFLLLCTGKSFSEALVLVSVNPQYDERLFIELQEKRCSEDVVYKNFFFFYFYIQNNICTQHVLNLYFWGDSMKNLSSYCGLADSKMRASDTDLPVRSCIYVVQPLLTSVRGRS